LVEPDGVRTRSDYYQGCGKREKKLLHPDSFFSAWNQMPRPRDPHPDDPVEAGGQAPLEYVVSATLT
jgi:hypothetical protein